MTTLAELRLANLREQKQKNIPAAPEPGPADPAAATAPEPAAPQSVPAASVRPDDLVLSQYLSETAEPTAAPAEGEVETDLDAEKSAALIARVHVCLAHKVQHPTGAKATVDMSPALFHRAKRYCLDHGNVTLRQLFLDLMTEFLAEEGY